MSKRVEPIKDKDDIKAMKESMIEDEDWAAYLMFTLGINFGLRISDLLKLKFNDLLDEGGNFKDKFKVEESKTKKRKIIEINQSVKEAVKKAINNTFLKRMDNYNRPLFWSKYKTKENMSRTTAHRRMKKHADKAGVEENISTHSLRKSYCYHLYEQTGDLALVQDLLNHESQKETLRYLGEQSEKASEATKKLNL